MRQSHSQYNEEKGILLGSLAKDDDLLLGILKQCEKTIFEREPFIVLAL